MYFTGSLVDQHAEVEVIEPSAEPTSLWVPDEHSLYILELLHGLQDGVDEVAFSTDEVYLDALTLNGRDDLGARGIKTLMVFVANLVAHLLACAGTHPAVLPKFTTKSLGIARVKDLQNRDWLLRSRVFDRDRDRCIGTITFHEDD